jgi:hypothetical protein
MKKYIFIFLIFSYNLFAQDYIEPDRGVIISSLNNEPFGLGRIIEVRFLNNESGKEIYYTGNDSWGTGVFWIIKDENRVDIIETYIRYQPMIKWHGLYIVEIFIPTGSPNRHSYFYDFRNNTLSQQINLPVYYDVNKDYVIAMVDDGLDLYDIKTNRKIKEYRCEEGFGALYMLVFGDYNIRITDNKLFFDFIIYTRDVNIIGNYIFEYN